MLGVEPCKHPPHRRRRRRPYLFWDATADRPGPASAARACSTAGVLPEGDVHDLPLAHLDWEDVWGGRPCHTFTVALRPTHVAFAGAEPYVVAIVELAEGPGRSPATWSVATSTTCTSACP